MIAVCQHLSTRVVVVSSLVVLFDGGVGANYQPRHNSEIASQNSCQIFLSTLIKHPVNLFVCSKFDQTFYFLLFHEPATAWNVRKFDPHL